MTIWVFGEGYKKSVLTHCAAFKDYIPAENLYSCLWKTARVYPKLSTPTQTEKYPAQSILKEI